MLPRASISIQISLRSLFSFTALMALLLAGWLAAEAIGIPPWLLLYLGAIPSVVSFVLLRCIWLGLAPFAVWLVKRHSNSG